MKDIVKLIRPKQWIKNLFLFPALIFSKHLLDLTLSLSVIQAFFAFSFAASTIYVINDWVDAEQDRLHPEKKSRPIASGKIGKTQVLIVILFLITLLIITSWSLPIKFKFVVVAYVVMNFLYSWRFKHQVVVDVLIIAAGFMLRVIAGAFAIDVPVSSWIILCTLFLSVFLASAKRKAELKTISLGETRRVLVDYSSGLIDKMLTISASGAIISYALYTTSPRTITEFRTENLIFTTVFVMYGIFRYLYLLEKKDLGENPTQILLSDRGIIINSICWALSILGFIYT